MDRDDIIQAVYLVAFILVCITFVIYAPLWATLAIVMKFMWNGMD